MPAVHPGRILRREMAARELTPDELATRLRVPATTVAALIDGKASVSAETALRLARYFSTSPQFWMNLQTRYDLALADHGVGERIVEQVEPPP